MKALLLISLLATVSCAPATVAGVGIVTGVALTTNIPAVEEAGDKYLSKE